MKTLLAFLLAGLAFAADDAPRVVFTKSFPGSSPPFTQITIAKGGSGLYQEDAKDDDPLKFQLRPAEASQIFDLAEKLDHFSHPLESGLKVASLGQKTFKWEGAGQPHQATFNYSENVDAKALTDIFESIADSARARINLERAVRFDKLGAQDAILRIEILRDQKRLMAAEQFLPMLDRIANNESFIHIARDRAAALAENIRSGK